jgi:hypothetical protein
LRAVRCDDPVLRRVEQKDQIDIARVVEFAAAELAHAENDEPAVRLRPLRIGEPDRAAFMGGAQQMTQRRTQGRFGEAAQRVHLLFEGPAPGKFGDACDESDAPSGDAQSSHQEGLVVVPADAGFDSADGLPEDRIGAVLDQAEQEAPFLGGESAQKRAVAEYGGKQPSPRLARRPSASAIRVIPVRCLGEGHLPGREAQLAKPGIGRLWRGDFRSGEVQ